MKRINIDSDKYNNALNSIKFSHLQKMEKEEKFIEKSKYAKFFFRMGMIDEWKKNVPLETIKFIEKEFYDEMAELDYL